MIKDVYFSDFELPFLKVNNNYQILKGADYQFKTIDGKTIQGNLRINSEGVYVFEMDNNYYNNFDNLLSLLPTSVQRELNSIQFVEDFANSNIEWSDYQTNNRTSTFYIPIKIIETKAPGGYQKLDLLTFMRIYASYKIDNNEITRINLSTGERSEQPIIIDNYSFDANNINHFTESYYIEHFSDLDTMTRICDGVTVRGKASFNDCYCSKLAYYFVNEEGTISLTINNTVNGVAKYDASDVKKLEYSIKVKNTGNASSENNVIITYMPKEITLDTTSIDNGTYDKSNHSITWNLDYLDADEEKEFTYIATAPKSINTENLIGYSTIESSQVQKVTSNKTIVTMKNIISTVNPNTGMAGLYIQPIDLFVPVNAIVIIIMVISITIVMIKGKVSIFKK